MAQVLTETKSGKKKERQRDKGQAGGAFSVVLRLFFKVSVRFDPCVTFTLKNHHKHSGAHGFKMEKKLVPG